MILSVNKRYLSLVFIFSSFLALLEVVFFVLSLNEANGSDFISYYTGAYTIRTGEGSKLYDLQVQYDNQQEILFKEQKSEVEDSFVGFIKILPYVNIPPLALFIIPLTFIPFIAAYKLFVLANLLLFENKKILFSRRIIRFIVFENAICSNYSLSTYSSSEKA